MAQITGCVHVHLIISDRAQNSNFQIKNVQIAFSWALIVRHWFHKPAISFAGSWESYDVMWTQPMQEVYRICFKCSVCYLWLSSVKCKGTAGKNKKNSPNFEKNLCLLFKMFTRNCAWHRKRQKIEVIVPKSHCKVTSMFWNVKKNMLFTVGWSSFLTAHFFFFFFF